MPSTWAIPNTFRIDLSIGPIGLSGSLEGVNSEFRIATKWPYNWSAGLIFGATGTAGRAPSFWRGFGAKFGRKSAENLKKQNTEYCKFTGFGAMDVTKPYKFIGFGACGGPY